MKFFRLDLLTLLISLFILNGCKNEDTIGLTNGTGTISGSLVDTATVFANTTKEDTVVTSGITNVPLGFFKDAVMGTTTSNVITDINLPGASISSNASYTVPSGTIYIDSAILTLKYASSGFYGDSLTSKYKVNVYQLGQRFYSTQNYYNDSQWTYNSDNVLGSATFYARPHDTLKVTSVVNGGPDTLIKVVPQVRIRIDTNFIRSNLFNDAYNQLATNVLFQSHVKGFYLSMDQTQPGPGGILMFQAPADSALEVHIRSVNGNTIDTSVVYLNISQHAAQIAHAYSAAVTAAKNNTTTHKDSLIYLQGLASLRSKISFPYIKSLFKSLGNNVVINRAEVVLTAAPGSDIPAYLTPQRYLSLYRYDIAHQRVSVEDATSTDPRSYSNSIFGGYYSLTTHQYHFLITSYIQDLLDGATVDYGTYIGVIDGSNTTSVDIAATPEATGRAVVVGNPSSNSSLYPYRIKLNIIYTKTK